MIVKHVINVYLKFMKHASVLNIALLVNYFDFRMYVVRRSPVVRRLWRCSSRILAETKKRKTTGL